MGWKVQNKGNLPVMAGGGRRNEENLKDKGWRRLNFLYSSITLPSE